MIAPAKTSTATGNAWTGRDGENYRCIAVIQCKMLFCCRLVMYLKLTRHLLIVGRALEVHHALLYPQGLRLVHIRQALSRSNAHFIPIFIRRTSAWSPHLRQHEHMLPHKLFDAVNDRHTCSACSMAVETHCNVPGVGWRNNFRDSLDHSFSLTKAHFRERARAPAPWDPCCWLWWMRAEGADHIDTYLAMWELLVRRDACRQ